MISVAQNITLEIRQQSCIYDDKNRLMQAMNENFLEETAATIGEKKGI